MEPGETGERAPTLGTDRAAWQVGIPGRRFHAGSRHAGGGCRSKKWRGATQWVPVLPPRVLPPASGRRALMLHCGPRNTPASPPPG